MDREEKEKALILICEIKEEGPFTAMGFFNIERSTLTSLVSTILTYLIVLVQFQPDNPNIQIRCCQMNCSSLKDYQ